MGRRTRTGIICRSDRSNRSGRSDRSPQERLERSERIERLFSFTNSEADEPLHLNVLARLGGRLRDQLADRDVRIANRRLIYQHELRIEVAPVSYTHLTLPTSDLV